VFEQMYREVLTINGVQDDTIKIEPISVINEMYTADQKLAVMTMDEKREAMGLPPLTAPAPQQMEAAYTSLEVKIVNLIEKDGLFSAEQLALLCKSTIEEVTITMKKLQERGIIKMVTNGNTGELLSELTEQGEKVAERFPMAFNSEHGFNDDELFEVFSTFGTTCDKFDLYKDEFAYTPDDKDKKILEYIKGDKKVTPEVIAEGIKMDIADVAERIATMEDNGILSSDVVTNQGEDIVERAITSEGTKILEDAGLDIKAVETFFAYRTRTDVPKPITNSRPFCVKMMDLTKTTSDRFKLFSRKDIDRLSSALGYNVWEQRGGYYHNPDTDITTPYCRHRWASVKIVRKK